MPSEPYTLDSLLNEDFWKDPHSEGALTPEEQGKLLVGFHRKTLREGAKVFKGKEYEAFKGATRQRFEQVLRAVNEGAPQREALMKRGKPGLVDRLVETVPKQLAKGYLDIETALNVAGSRLISEAASLPNAAINAFGGKSQFLEDLLASEAEFRTGIAGTTDRVLPDDPRFGDSLPTEISKATFRNLPQLAGLGAVAIATKSQAIVPFISAVALEGGEGYSSVVQTLREKGIDPVEADAAGMHAYLEQGVSNAALEVIPIFGWVRSLDKKSGGAASSFLRSSPKVAAALQGRSANAVKQAVTEGITEWLQTRNGQRIATQFAPELREELAGYDKEEQVATGAGATLGFIMGALIPGKNRGRSRTDKIVANLAKNEDATLAEIAGVDLNAAETGEAQLYVFEGKDGPQTVATIEVDNDLLTGDLVQMANGDVVSKSKLKPFDPNNPPELQEPSSDQEVVDHPFFGKGIELFEEGGTKEDLDQQVEELNLLGKEKEAEALAAGFKGQDTPANKLKRAVKTREKFDSDPDSVEVEDLQAADEAIIATKDKDLIEKHLGSGVVAALEQRGEFRTESPPETSQPPTPAQTPTEAPKPAEATTEPKEAVPPKKPLTDQERLAKLKEERSRVVNFSPVDVGATISTDDLEGAGDILGEVMQETADRLDRQIADLEAKISGKEQKGAVRVPEGPDAIRVPVGGGVFVNRGATNTYEVDEGQHAGNTVSVDGPLADALVSRPGRGIVAVRVKDEDGNSLRLGGEQGKAVISEELQKARSSANTAPQQAVPPKATVPEGTPPSNVITKKDGTPFPNKGLASAAAKRLGLTSFKVKKLGDGYVVRVNPEEDVAPTEAQTPEQKGQKKDATKQPSRVPEGTQESNEDANQSPSKEGPEKSDGVKEARDAQVGMPLESAVALRTKFNADPMEEHLEEGAEGVDPFELDKADARIRATLDKELIREHLGDAIVQSMENQGAFADQPGDSGLNVDLPPPKKPKNPQGKKADGKTAEQRIVEKVKPPSKRKLNAPKEKVAEENARGPALKKSARSHLTATEQEILDATEARSSGTVNEGVDPHSKEAAKRRARVLAVNVINQWRKLKGLPPLPHKDPGTPLTVIDDMLYLQSTFDQMTPMQRAEEISKMRGRLEVLGQQLQQKVVAGEIGKDHIAVKRYRDLIQRYSRLFDQMNASNTAEAAGSVYNPGGDASRATGASIFQLYDPTFHMFAVSKAEQKRLAVDVSKVERGIREIKDREATEEAKKDDPITDKSQLKRDLAKIDEWLEKKWIKSTDGNVMLSFELGMTVAAWNSFLKIAATMMKAGITLRQIHKTIMARIRKQHPDAHFRRIGEKLAADLMEIAPQETAEVAKIISQIEDDMVKDTKTFRNKRGKIPEKDRFGGVPTHIDLSPLSGDTMAFMRGFDARHKAIRRGRVLGEGSGGKGSVVFDPQNSTAFRKFFTKIFTSKLSQFGSTIKHHFIYRGNANQLMAAANNVVKEFEDTMENVYPSTTVRNQALGIISHVIQNPKDIDAIAHPVVREKVEQMIRFTELSRWISTDLAPEFSESFWSIENWNARRYEAFRPGAPNRWQALWREAAQGDKESKRILSNAIAWVREYEFVKTKDGRGEVKKRTERIGTTPQEELNAAAATLINMVDRKEDSLSILDDIAQSAIEEQTITAASGSFKTRKDIPAPIREYLGEIKDPASVFMGSVGFHAQFIGHVAAQQKVRELLQEYNIIRDKPDQKFTINLMDPESGLGSSKGTAGFADYAIGPNGAYRPRNMYVTKETAVALREIAAVYHNQVTNSQLLAWTWSNAVQLTKFGKVVSPAGIPINVSGAVMMTMFSGVNPLQYFNPWNPAFKAAWGKRVKLDSSETFGRPMENFQRAQVRGDTLGKDIRSGEIESLDRLSDTQDTGLERRHIDLPVTFKPDDNLGLNEFKNIKDAVVAVADSTLNLAKFKGAREFRIFMTNLKKAAFSPGGFVLKKPDDIARAVIFFDLIKTHNKAAAWAIKNKTVWPLQPHKGVLTEMPTVDEISEIAGEELSRVFVNYDRVPTFLKRLSTLGVVNTFISYTSDLARVAIQAPAQTAIHFANAREMAGGDMTKFASNPYMHKAARMAAWQMGSVYAATHTGVAITSAALGSSFVQGLLRGGDDDDDDKEVVEGQVLPDDSHKLAFERSLVPNFHKGFDTYILAIDGTNITYGTTEYILPITKVTQLWTSAQGANEVGRNTTAAVLGQIAREVIAIDPFNQSEEGDLIPGMLNESILRILTNSNTYGGKISNATTPFAQRVEVLKEEMHRLRPTVVDLVQKSAWLNINPGAEAALERKPGEGSTTIGARAYTGRWITPLRTLTIKLDGPAARGKLRSNADQYSTALRDYKKAKKADDVSEMAKQKARMATFVEKYDIQMRDMIKWTEVSGLTKARLMQLESDLSIPVGLRYFFRGREKPRKTKKKFKF